MKYDRIEIRLDEEHQRKIAELKEAYGTSASDILRRGIDAMYEEKAKERRKKALERLLALEPDDTVPQDMDTLKRQLGRHPDYLQDDVADPD
jgi:Arc/MetJ-type ribon-helix-helix transcriptional regulator